MRFRVLGPVEIEANDGRIIKLPRRRERCLLGLLLLEPGRVIGLDRLCDLLWDADPPAGARHAVHNHISAIRGVLSSAAEPDATLISHGAGYLIRVDPAHVDIHRMRQLVEGSRLIDDPAQRRQQLRAAVDLWRGPVLHNAAGSRLRELVCGEFDELHLAATEDLLAVELQLGNHAAVLPELIRLNAAHPLRERPVALQARALHATGRTPEALDLLRRTRELMIDQLGLEPGPELAELQRAILRPGPAAPGRAAPATAVPSRLPRGVPDFTGRADTLALLDQLSDSGTPAVLITTMAGAGGVGKTALAVHWARQSARRYPDGRLFVDLRSYSTEPALSTHTVLTELLGALGVPDRDVPARVDRAAALYRAKTADKSLLVVIDNASHPEQVRPLLPAGAGSLALITSRDPLAGLIARDAARLIQLDELELCEAVALLTTIIGPTRAAAEPEALQDLARECACLPLALRIAAAQLVINPTRTVAEQVALIRSRWLSELSIEHDAKASVRVAYCVSLRAMSLPAQHLFALCSLVPGPHITVAVAASLAGLSREQAASLLAEISRSWLIQDVGEGRFVLHDLLQAFAVEQVVQLPLEVKHEARQRMLGHYAHTADHAATVFDPVRDAPALPPAAHATTIDRFTTYERALAYFNDELPCLLAVIQHTYEAGHQDFTVALAAAAATYLQRRGRWHDMLGVQAAALGAARARNHLADQATARRLTAVAHSELGDHVTGYSQLIAALRLHTTAGDHLGEAHTYYQLAVNCQHQDLPEEALQYMEHAHLLYQKVGHLAGQAAGLNRLGGLHLQAGDFEEALAMCASALPMLQELRDFNEEAVAWDHMASAHQQLNADTEALNCYGRALALYRTLRDAVRQADVLNRIGDLHHRQLCWQAARDAWRSAADLLDSGHPDLPAIRAKLDRLPGEPGS